MLFYWELGNANTLKGFASWMVVGPLIPALGRQRQRESLGVGGQPGLQAVPGQDSQGYTGKLCLNPPPPPPKAVFSPIQQ